jgi:hypothetical protein
MGANISDVWKTAEYDHGWREIFWFSELRAERRSAFDESQGAGLEHRNFPRRNADDGL